jgi:hypothetical protein
MILYMVDASHQLIYVLLMEFDTRAGLPSVGFANDHMKLVNCILQIAARVYRRDAAGMLSSRAISSRKISIVVQCSWPSV